MIHQLVTSPEWEKADCSSIKTTGSGAAFLPPELRVKFQSELKSTLYQGYGSTESVRTLLFASTIPERLMR
jgi:acyl-coenzyme A synthetase/AMP-(fatty) acid ligase